jgi:hypothetical protein
MQTFMSEAIVLEATLVSVLLALWMTWLVLRGLFHLMPATSSPVANRAVRPIRVAQSGQPANRRRDAA